MTVLVATVVVVATKGTNHNGMAVTKNPIYPMSRREYNKTSNADADAADDDALLRVVMGDIFFFCCFCIVLASFDTINFTPSDINWGMTI